MRTDEPVAISAQVRRNTLLICVGQATTWATVGVFVALGPLIVYQMTGSSALAGALFAIWSIGVAVGAQATGFAMDRVGRRPGLAVGQFILALASLMAVVAALVHSAPLMLITAAVGGLGAGGALLARLAVPDMFPPAPRGYA